MLRADYVRGLESELSHVQETQGDPVVKAKRVTDIKAELARFVERPSTVAAKSGRRPETA